MTLFILVWIACGLLAWGGIFAYVQGEYSLIAAETRRFDRFLAICFGLFGPIGLVSFALGSLVLNGNWLFRHGLKF